MATTTTTAATTTTTAAPALPSSAELLDFLRRSSLLRANEEGRSWCEREVDLSSGKAPTVWLVERAAASGGDFYLLCMRTSGPFDHIDVTLRTPAGQPVVDARFTPDPTHTVFTTTGPEPGLALLGRIEGERSLRFVGMTEPSQNMQDTGWIAQAALLLSVQRPEGAWNVSVTVDGTPIATTTLPIDDHCDASPPSRYTAPNPLVVDPRTAVASQGGSVSHADNCRVMPELTGADFVATEAAVRAQAAYGEFTVDVVYGNCGLPTAAGGINRDNRGGLVEATLPDGGWAYEPGHAVTLMRTITCPAFPNDLMEIRTAPNGFRSWEAKPIKFDDVRKVLDNLAKGYPDWRWSTPTSCAPGAIVTKYWARERNVYGGVQEFAAFPDLLEPEIAVAC